MGGWSTSLDLSSQWPLLLVALAGVVLATVLVVIAILARDSRSPLAWSVGATAGLQGAQIANIHAFCLAVAAWLLLGGARQRAGQARLAWPLVIVAVAGMLASTALTGSLVNNRLTAIQVMLLACAAAGLAGFADRRDLLLALRGLLAVTSVACSAAVLQYVHVLPYAVYLGTRRPIGIYSEPDWMGMFAAIGLVLAFRLGRRAWRLPLMLLHVLALILTTARAAWLALVVVLVLGWTVAKINKRAERVERLPGGRWMVGVVALVVVITVMATPALGDSLQERLEGVSTSHPDMNALARLQQNDSLMSLESQSPWNGLGLTASGRVGVSGRITTLGPGTNNVASNWMLGWWVDGGLLALGLILVFLWAACARLSETSGLALAVVLLSSLFSNAMLIPIAWLLLGLCLARARPTEAEQRAGRVPGTQHSVPVGVDRSGGRDLVGAAGSAVVDTVRGRPARPD